MLNLTNVTIAELTLEEAQAAGQPLLLFIAGIVVYALFVFHFYRFLARKDIFRLNLSQYSEGFLGFLGVVGKFILHFIEYILIFPLFVFFWFVVVAGILVFLAKNPIADTLLISMALVASVRITAYYSEDLSRDLAKMFPFALLGVFLVDMSFFSFDQSIALLQQVPQLSMTLLYYFLFIIGLEFVLRLLSYVLWPLLRRKEEKKDTSDERRGTRR
ncbi:hypothetical protein JXB02_06840 [Candidatus Woesearchaeota archaeon]|nr:hypothetical protein [Candidatus Woesearchaeota archaeon]